MSDSFKYTRNMIEWRRNMVVSYLAKGWSQQDIAKKLEIHPSTISLDVQFLKEKSKKELETHISDRLPFEYARALEGMNTVLKKVSDIEDAATDTKTKLECSKLKMDLYRSIMSLATDGGVIERAMKMIKIIAPLPGEDIHAESQEQKEQKAAEEDITDEVAEAEAKEDPAEN